jgi:hypothetical protein
MTEKRDYLVELQNKIIELRDKIQSETVYTKEQFLNGELGILIETDTEKEMFITFLKENNLPTSHIYKNMIHRYVPNKGIILFSYTLHKIAIETSPNEYQQYKGKFTTISRIL